jgi:hypothetical protein
MPKKVKRSLEIHLTDGSTKTLELSKAVALDMPDTPGMIHFDQLTDGSWRLIYTTPLFGKTFRDIEKIVVVRNDGV